MTKDEALSAKHEGATTVALKLALEALGHFEKAGLATLKTIDAITAIREVLALSESSTKCEETSHAQPDVDRRSTESKETFDQQEPVAWGVDWGKAGDIACVSIIKRLPNDVIEVVAVEYAPYSYTTPPQRKPLTDEDLETMAEKYVTNCYFDTLKYARAIEAAHAIKEKNT